MNIDDVLAKVVPARRTVPVCLDGSIATRLDDAQARWLTAVAYDRDHNEAPTASAVVEEIAALRAEADDATVEFTVEAIGAGPWRRLVGEHPPTDDEAKDGWRWNLTEFPPASLAASCVDPKMDEDQAVTLAERLSDGQWTKLFNAVLAVNLGDDIPKFALGIDGPTTSEPSLTTADPEASPTASSLVNAASPDPAN